MLAFKVEKGTGDIHTRMESNIIKNDFMIWEVGFCYFVVCLFLILNGGLSSFHHRDDVESINFETEPVFAS